MIKKFINLLKDFNKISFWAHSNWNKKHKIFHIIPALGTEWDIQCSPMAENGKITFEGSREFTIFFEWLWFSVGMCFEFKWTVKNPKDFEQPPLTEEEAKKHKTLIELFASKEMVPIAKEQIADYENDSLNFDFEYIEIDKHYFGFDENGDVTYDCNKMMNRNLEFKEKCEPYVAAFCRKKAIQMYISDGHTIYLFKNKDSRDGLWHRFCPGDTAEYNYRMVNLKKL